MRLSLTKQECAALCLGDLVSVHGGQFSHGEATVLASFPLLPRGSIYDLFNESGGTATLTPIGERVHDDYIGTSPGAGVVLTDSEWVAFASLMRAAFPDQLENALKRRFRLDYLHGFFEFEDLILPFVILPYFLIMEIRCKIPRDGE